jgi:hypothetical protein
MDRNRGGGGGGVKPPTRDHLEEMHDLLARRLPLLPAEDPLREQLVGIERKLRDCRRPAGGLPRLPAHPRAAAAEQSAP